MQKENEKAAREKKREEAERIRALVELARRMDPRLRRRDMQARRHRTAPPAAFGGYMEVYRYMVYGRHAPRRRLMCRFRRVTVKRGSLVSRQVPARPAAASAADGILVDGCGGWRMDSWHLSRSGHSRGLNGGQFWACLGCAPRARAAGYPRAWPAQPGSRCVGCRAGCPARYCAALMRTPKPPLSQCTALSPAATLSGPPLSRCLGAGHTAAGHEAACGCPDVLESPPG